MVERRRHLRQHARIAIGVAIHQRTEARTLRMLAERAQHRPALEAGAVRVGHENRIEVIEDPKRVVTPLVGQRPETRHAFPFDMLLRGLNPEADWMRVHRIEFPLGRSFNYGFDCPSTILTLRLRGVIVNEGMATIAVHLYQSQRPAGSAP